MELLFRKHFVLFALGFLHSISLVAPATLPWFEWFNIHTYDIVPLEKFRDFYPTCAKCPYVYYPICGDDNKTYINECKLNCRNSKRAKQVNMTRSGPCKIFTN